MADQPATTKFSKRSRALRMLLGNSAATTVETRLQTRTSIRGFIQRLFRRRKSRSSSLQGSTTQLIPEVSLISSYVVIPEQAVASLLSPQGKTNLEPFDRTQHRSNGIFTDYNLSTPALHPDGDESSPAWSLISYSAPSTTDLLTRPHTAWAAPSPGEEEEDDDDFNSVPSVDDTDHATIKADLTGSGRGRREARTERWVAALTEVGMCEVRLAAGGDEEAACELALWGDECARPLVHKSSERSLSVYSRDEDE